MSEKLNKNIIDVKIHGKQYSLKGYEDVGYLQQIAVFVDTKMNEITKLCPGLNTSSVAVLTSINVSDLYFKEKNKILNQEKQGKTEFNQAIERLKKQNENLLNDKEKLMQECNKQKQLLEENLNKMKQIKNESFKKIKEVEEKSLERIEEIKNEDSQIIKEMENDKLRNNKYNIEKITELEKQKKLLEELNSEKNNEIEKLKDQYLDLKKEFEMFIAEFDNNHN